MYNKIFFENTLIEVGSLHLYGSFGTFCVQIGQFLEVHWVFEKCLKTENCRFRRKMTLISNSCESLRSHCASNITNNYRVSLRGALWQRFFCSNAYLYFLVGVPSLDVLIAFLCHFSLAIVRGLEPSLGVYLIIA